MPGRIGQAIVLLLGLLILSVGALAQGATEYRLGASDKLRVTVFGEEDLSGEFELDGSGTISLPLIGQVQADRLTLRELEDRIVTRLKDGYLRDPKVNIEVLNYRPFYILGEVNSPGSYPYRAGLNVLNAVVIGGGYTPRADESDITIVRAADSNRQEQRVGPDDIVLPGDILRVKERFF
ncbi:MAG: polysaccharide biosynthesis/export family protein [Pseudomonadota bacterium]|nr:polysaccharide biosynthesis/export family protein [Pseudomonadota bacterium]